MNKKNDGVVPVIFDERVKKVPIGCGNCIECRKQKAREWQVRMLEDIREHKNGKFVTLTFSDESICELIEDIRRKDKLSVGYDLDNAIAIRGVRLFLERWRKEFKKSLRHWFITELGHSGTKNIHMHGIVWTDEMEKVEKHWRYGFVWKGNYVNERTVNYCIKYVSKMDEENKGYCGRVLCSSGIGGNYVNRVDAKNNRYNGAETQETYRTRTGHKMAMPVYWRNKIYSEEERERLWLQKLNKETRWVLGNEIDISKGDKEYIGALKYAREKNLRLGYRSDEPLSQEEEQYERDRRILMQQTRIAKAKEKLRRLGNAGRDTPKC